VAAESASGAAFAEFLKGAIQKDYSGNDEQEDDDVSPGDRGRNS
jgi:hypothetical protein